jgi:hypothetical protein
MGWTFLKMFIDAGKIGGWVRAAVAALGGSSFGVAACRVVPSLCGEEFKTALSIVLTTIAVGLWSQLVKSK